MTAYLASVANDGTNSLFISSSANGQTWSSGTEINQFSKLAPALTVWQNKLWLAFVANNDGFFVTSNAANSGEDLITGVATPGEPIVGSATLPAGTTMTVSVDNGPKQSISNGAFSIPVPAQVGATQLPKAAAPTPYSSVTATPGIVRPGGRVTISGNAPKNARAGKWITLTSDAFASKRSVNGIPAIRAQVLVNGKYSVKATIRSGLKPTTYAVSGSFNGRSLDTVAWMKVRGR